MNLAAVTCHFNFSRARSRRENHHLFALHLADIGLPLWICEARLPGDPLDLSPDADWAIEVPDAIWLKENLLNYAIRRLPAGYDAVAWIDNDSIDFPPNLVERTCKALEKHAVVQMFSTAFWQNADGTRGSYLKRGQGGVVSMARRNAERAGEKRVDPLHDHPGLAWAARREVLDQIGGLYDRDISGGGDVWFALGCWGDWQAHWPDGFSVPLRDDAMAWARKAYAVIQGDVGFIDVHPLHLYHGPLRARRYTRRHAMLRQHAFDPAVHLETTPGGIFRLAEECPHAIRQWLREHLVSQRKEDFGLAR